jgi:hypothetical protein
MRTAIDIIDRPIKEGDFVAFYANVYRVLDIGLTRTQIRMILADPSPSTRPVWKYSRETCVIPAEEVTFWLLKRRS